MNKQTIWLSRLFGLALLLAGGVFALAGPAEITVFYMFSEGGRFHFPGFGFGSFMFAYLVIQVIVYYLIALVCLPLAYGHFRRCAWAVAVMRALLVCWLALGIPLGAAFTFILLAAKEFPSGTIAFILFALAAAYLVLPWLLMRFYNSPGVTSAFKIETAPAHSPARRPLFWLASSFLMLFFALALHVPILTNGLYPIFGGWWTGLRGITTLGLTAWVFGLLAWGLYRMRPWAWWGALLALGALAVSGMLSILGTPYLDLLALANFPPYEIDFLDGIPLQPIHLVLLLITPLAATIAALILARREGAKT